MVEQVHFIPIFLQHWLIVIKQLKKIITNWKKNTRKLLTLFFLLCSFQEIRNFYFFTVILKLWITVKRFYWFLINGIRSSFLTQINTIFRSQNASRFFDFSILHKNIFGYFFLSPYFSIILFFFLFQNIFFFKFDRLTRFSTRKA